MGVAASVGLALAIFSIVSNSNKGRVAYPYWCRDCKAVYDVNEMRTDPDKWRIAPRGGSDSVVICIKCDKGYAYPAVPCGDCGAHHLLHIFPDTRCPKCHPDVNQAAEKLGIDLMPPELE